MAIPVKGRADYLEVGDFNAACSMCGRKRKANTMVRNWQGLWRCPEHNEPRQWQDFVRGIADIITPPWTQPEEDTFTQVCTFNGCAAVCGVGTCGCMTCGRYAWDMDFYPPIPPRPYLMDNEGNYILDPATGNPIIVPPPVPLPAAPPVPTGFTADSDITADSTTTVS